MNGRLDTLQAGILLEKLAIFPDEIVARNRIARRYSDALGNMLSVPNAGFYCRFAARGLVVIGLIDLPSRCV